MPISDMETVDHAAENRAFEEWIATRNPADQTQVAHDDPPEVAIERRLAERFDRNFVILEAAVMELRNKLKRPPRPRRTASAARVNPDKLWFGVLITALNGLFILGAFTVQFGGQYGFAPRTQLPNGLWWFIPLALDAPVVISAFTAAVYRRRKQNARANGNWAFVLGLSALGSVIQITHVLELASVHELAWSDFLGAAIMGLMPWIVLYLSENLAGLLVRPLGEARETIEPPAATAPRKTPTRARSKR